MKTKPKYLVLLLSILLFSVLILAGCGQEANAAGKAAAGGKHMFNMSDAQFTLFIGLFLADLAVAVFCGFKIFQRYLAATNGTNAVTKFVRFSTGNLSIRRWETYCILMSAIVMVLDTVNVGLMGIVAGIPTFIIMIVGVVFQFKIRNNEERVKAARAVTKGGLAVGGTAATIAAAPVAIAGIGTSAAGAALAGGIGLAVGGAAAASASDSMNDTDLPDFAKSIGMSLQDFMEKAQRAGIRTEGRTPQEVATDVVRFAPETTLKDIDPSLDNMTKAVCILSGRTAPPAIEGPTSA